MRYEIYKLALKQLMLFCLWIVLARVSRGFVLPVMILVGMVASFNGKFGNALSVYTMMLMMTTLNPNILPMSGIMFSFCLRFGPLIIGLALAIRAITIENKQAIPLGVMLAYLLVALVSSMGGWYPPVSYLKLVNFTAFFLGVWLGTKGLQVDEKGVKILRATILAVAIFVIVGSAVLWPFPGISTLNSLRMLGSVSDVAMRNEIVREMIDSGNMILFCGVTSQSQMLSPLLSCLFAWVLCDLLFVERAIRYPHIGLLILTLPLLYLTRSRVALLSVVALLIMVYSYLSRKIYLGRKTKMWLGHILMAGGVALIATVVISEINSNVISRWVRKTDDVEADRRSISEAFTDSRQELIEMCMDDFRRNPLFGMGFQVAEYTKTFATENEGLILSSPIEKGVIPLMVLGETGILGAVVFAIFLITFYSRSANRGLYITLTMMTVFLVINMGEATFFSPGGIGGPEWMFCIIGGYVLDLANYSEQRKQMYLVQRYM